ncbi:MAG: hypothetical protein HQL84_14620 [Magnetococcales bacterium]|nr:hypothetical protein [Magnetococcales bacterium]MBF0151252.1 hypothetical protein [Magnetococcales bacterium]MBF0174880.1 hypothetical protein [Magnetococcales bacterium]
MNPTSRVPGHHSHPWPLFMSELVSVTLLVIVISVGFSMIQGSPPTLNTTVSSLPLVEPSIHESVPFPNPKGDERTANHEERLLMLMERMNERLDTLIQPDPPRDLVDAMDRLGQHMEQATRAMVTAQTLGQQEQTANHDMLLKIQERIEHMAGMMTGFGPNLQGDQPTTGQEGFPGGEPDANLQSRDPFFSRLRTFLTRQQLRIFINPGQATITLPSILDFDPGSSHPGPRQRRALTVLAQGLAQFLPCHVAHPPQPAHCPNPPSPVRVDTIRIRGQAAFAHPGEPRFFFNWKLATARAYRALDLMLATQPDLIAMKNSRGQTLFQIEGRIAKPRGDQGGQRLDLRFFFEEPDNGSQIMEGPGKEYTNQ